MKLLTVVQQYSSALCTKEEKKEERENIGLFFAVHTVFCECCKATQEKAPPRTRVPVSSACWRSSSSDLPHPETISVLACGQVSAGAVSARDQAGEEDEAEGPSGV